MTTLVIKAKELVKALDKLGFRLVRKSEGSHWQFEHPDGRRTTVPMHKGVDVGPGLLRKILRDVEIDAAELQKYL